MKPHELNVPVKKSRKRVGRGIGSGYGKTAGRGTKGQNSRSGGGVRPGFEGGQNPLMKRIPKTRGFSKVSRKVDLIHTDQLQNFKKDTVITKKVLVKAGLIKTGANTVKLLYRGDLKQSLTVQLDLASEKARLAVEAAGGKVEKQ